MQTIVEQLRNEQLLVVHYFNILHLLYFFRRRISISRTKCITSSTSPSNSAKQLNVRIF